MALQVTNLTRVFKMKKDGKEITLTDLPGMPPADVMKFYAATYPELTNGVVQGPVVVKDNAIYTMTTKAGQLG